MEFVVITLGISYLNYLSKTSNYYYMIACLLLKTGKSERIVIVMEDKQQQTIERLLDIIEKTLDNSSKQNEKALEILNKTNRRNAIKDALILISLLSFFIIVYFF